MSRRPVLVYLVCFSALATVACVATRGFVLDDAFITFRYGKHLAENGHATWNAPGVDATPFGFTTIAWMLLSAVWTMLVHDGARVLLCARIASAASLGIAIVLLASRFARVSSLRVGLLLGALTFGLWAEGIHVNGGMETLTFSVAILAVAWARDRVRNPVVPYAIAAAATFVRPEGVVCFVVLALFDVHARRYRDAVFGCAVGAVVLVITLAILQRVYGSVASSAVSVKVVSFRPKLSSSRAIAVFLLFYALVPLIACVRATRVDRIARFALALSVAILSAVSFAYPIMNFQARYEWPVLFLLAYGGASGLRGVGVRVLAASALFALTCAVFTGLQAATVAACGREQYVDSVAIASALGRAAGGKGTLALTEAGTLPYFADLTTRDVTGLADGHVERSFRRTTDVVCDPDVTYATFLVLDTSRDLLDLERCGFARRAIRPYVCGDRSEAMYIFSRDARVLERLPPVAAPRDDCYYLSVREGWRHYLFVMDTELSWM